MMALADLLVKVVSIGAGKTLQRFLTGAGVGLVTSQIVLTVVNSIIDKAITEMGLFSAVGLLGLSGVDVGLSIIIFALVARATMASKALNFTSLKK